MSLRRLQEFNESSITVRRETSGEQVPGPQEIRAKLALIRSRWTGQEGLRRIRRARCIHAWLLALSHRGPAEN